MKNSVLRMALLVAGLLPVASTTFAQTGTTYLSGASNAYSLSLGNYYSFNLGYSHTYLGLNMRPGGNGWLLGTDGANNGGSMLMSNVGGALTFITIPTASPSNPQSLSDAQVIDYRRMQISPSGQVMIGKTTPTTQTDYKLAIEGKLVAQSIYVTAPGTWADFVFAPSYKCMPLPELEAYLTANKHLPLIPAASQVEANGYNVTEMDAKLLQTIEELTLQVIRLGKEVEQLKAERAVGSK
ncbi:MAG: hypothetical protein ACRYFV_18615 [Janthinobacterium lividum]